MSSSGSASVSGLVDQRWTVLTCHDQKCSRASLTVKFASLGKYRTEKGLRAIYPKSQNAGMVKGSAMLLKDSLAVLSAHVEDDDDK